ncbi:MAG: aldehyde dehydrogenase family protein [Halobacteria archaeon]
MSVQKQDYSEDADWNKLYIGGDWITPDRDTLPVENPATQEVFAEVPAGEPEDVEKAYEAAEEAQDEWAERDHEERVEVVRKAKNLINKRISEVMDMLAVEAGSSKPKSMGEFEYSRGIMDWVAEYEPEEIEEDSSFEGKTNRVKRVPAGTIGVICPWNFPFYLAIRAVAPAVAFGNSVVLKPSSETPITGGLLIAKLFEEAGLPEGVLNVVTGKGSDIGDDVVSNPTAEVVSFTGSTGVGRRVGRLAGDNLAEVTLELGGNAPHVVLDDADVDWAVEAGLYGTYMHQGQICISINRHLVHESIYDEYVEKFVERVENEVHMGDPGNAMNLIGPIINESQRDQIIDFIERSVEAGATLETGGESDGLFVEPTVLSDATNEMAAACNEHFGPVAPIIPFSSDEEAVEIANDTEYGLSSSVHSGDIEHAREVADQIEAGMLHINDQPIHDEPHMPFGGVKNSGVGRFNGEWIVDEVTETKWISEQSEPRDYLIF